MLAVGATARSIKTAIFCIYYGIKIHNAFYNNANGIFAVFGSNANMLPRRFLKFCSHQKLWAAKIGQK